MKAIGKDISNGLPRARMNIVVCDAKSRALKRQGMLVPEKRKTFRF